MMISLECLKSSGNLPFCPQCHGANRCDEICAFLPKLANRCFIAPDTGIHLDSGDRRGLEEADLQDIFTDTLLAIEGGIEGFEGRRNCTFNTWAFSVFNNKRHDKWRQKYRDQDKEELIDNDDITLIETITPEILLERKSSKQDIATAIRYCFRQLISVNKNCGELLHRVYRLALQSFAEDGAFEFSSSGAINLTEIFNSLASQWGKKPGAIKRRFYRCREDYEPMLQECLAKQLGPGF